MHLNLVMGVYLHLDIFTGLMHVTNIHQSHLFLVLNFKPYVLKDDVFVNLEEFVKTEDSEPRVITCSIPPLHCKNYFSKFGNLCGGLLEVVLKTSAWTFKGGKN